MHCENHPTYKGLTEIKRLAKCEGCRNVRQSFLAGRKERKNKGKGSQFSITSPGFRCGIAHLMAEVGTVILYGLQPPFFWRQGVKSDPRAKEHYKKTYGLLSFRLQKDKNLSIGQALWSAWENEYHKVSRTKEHKQSIKLCINEAQPAQIEEPESKSGYFSNTHINPLKFGGEYIDGEEEERSF